MIPLRIQRKRVKGWKMPANTVNCTRPGRNGNHYVVWKDDDDLWTVSWRGCHYMPKENTKEAALAFAVEKFRDDIETEGPHNYLFVDPVPTHSDIIRDLRGHNLACFCHLCDKHKDGKPLNVRCADCAPCHVDPLGELANGFVCEAAA